MFEKFPDVRSSAGLMLLLVFSTPSYSAQLVFDQGFEEPTVLPAAGVSSSLWTFSTDGAGKLTITSTLSREGGRSLMTEIIKKGTTNFRQELRIRVPADTTPMKGSPPQWLGVSIYVPKESSLVDDSLVVQWHGKNDDARNSSPAVGLRIRNGKWLMTREVGTHTGADLGTVETEKWTDWVFKVVWRTDTTGTLQMWKNGAEVLNWKNLQTGADIDEYCPYIKLGRYSSSFKYSGVEGVMHRTYHDSVRVGFGSSVVYADVAPRGKGSIAPLAPVLDVE